MSCKDGKIKLSKDRSEGQILNLSQGGMLLATDQSVPEGDFVLLTLNLNGVITLEGVLGKIKRAERSEEGDFLMGVEFALKAELEKISSQDQVDSLPVKVMSFGQKVRETIGGYLRTTDLIAKEK
ncbi:MAG: PilZ domain-containing protein [Candidatus Zixiibacteriota bacterium]